MQLQLHLDGIKILASILITGATGLIGFRILLLALEAGHNVRYTARSEEKARIVTFNPAVQKLAPGDRLSSVIIPDFTVDGAFDSALQGVTHIIHAGSPVPDPANEPTTQVFQPTIKISLFSSVLLQSALKSAQRTTRRHNLINRGQPRPHTRNREGISLVARTAAQSGPGDF